MFLVFRSSDVNPVLLYYACQPANLQPTTNVTHFHISKGFNGGNIEKVLNSDIMEVSEGLGVAFDL